MKQQDRKVLTDWTEYPFIVRLTAPHKRDKSKRITFTGTAIGKHHILTVAHCLVYDNGEKDSPEDITITLSTRGQIVGQDICSISIPDRPEDIEYRFDLDGFKNDLAIIKIHETIPNDLLVALPESQEEERRYPSGYEGKLAGFGTSNPHLLGVEDPKHCTAEFARLAVYEENSNFYHARVLTVNADITPGDGGSPLLVKRDDGEWLQIGVTSQSAYYDSKDRPGAIFGLGVCTRVTHSVILSWIQEIVGLCDMKT